MFPHHVLGVIFFLFFLVFTGSSWPCVSDIWGVVWRESLELRKYWKVIATARSKDSLPEVADQKWELDLASHKSVTDLTDALVQAGQTIDCIIHNVGFNPKDQKEVSGYFESMFCCNDFSAANVAESMIINALHPMDINDVSCPFWQTMLRCWPFPVGWVPLPPRRCQAIMDTLAARRR